MKRSVMSAALESLGYSGTQIEAVFEAHGLALRAEQNRRAYRRRQQIHLLKTLNSADTAAETAENRKRKSIQRLKRLNSADTATERAVSADTATETAETPPSPRSLPFIPSPFSPCTPSSPSPIIPSPTPLSQTTITRAREKKGRRLPEGWRPSPGVYDFGRDLGLSGETIGRELGAFQDYWLAKPGANGTKLDWDATFRNWLRKSAERIRPVDSGYKSPRTRQQEEFLAKLRREIEEDEKNEQSGGGEENPGLFPRADGESRVHSVGRFQVVAGGRTDGLWGARSKGRCQPHHSYSDVLDLPDDWRD
jgi:uncharacterized protein YifE (UPF0438 family)